MSWHGVRPATSGTDKLNKAFTLIELLIVISILAILGSAISIVLNPAELLAEARDSQRINDLESLRNSLSLTLIDNPSLFDSLSNTSIYLSLPSSSCLTNPPSGYTYICNATSLNLQKTDSTGWLPLSLTNLPVFPIDPINSSSSSLYYAFVPDLTNKTFVLTSLLESEKYLKLSALKDGGTDPGRIEEGNPSLWTAASGLVGYWPMDEGTGTTTQDLSGNNNTGTLTNGPTWTASSSCKVGQCLSFDRTLDQYINAGSVNITAPKLTVIGWFNTSELNNNRIYSSVAGMDGAGPDPDSSYHRRDSITVQSNGSVSSFMSSYNCSGGASNINISTASTEVFTPGQWVFFTQANDYPSANTKLYINGKFQSQTTSSGTTCTISNFKYLWIGRRKGSNNMHGTIDDFRVYNRLLSEAEIQAIYSAQK